MLRESRPSPLRHTNCFICNVDPVASNKKCTWFKNNHFILSLVMYFTSLNTSNLENVADVFSFPLYCPHLLHLAHFFVPVQVLPVLNNVHFVSANVDEYTVLLTGSYCIAVKIMTKRVAAVSTATDATWVLSPCACVRWRLEDGKRGITRHAL